MIRLQLTEESLQETRKAWERIENMVSGLPEPRWFRIAETVREGFAYNFDVEAAGGEEPWEPLAPRTVAERRALGFGPEHPILIRTRELYYSLVDEQHPLNYFWIEQNAGRLTMEFGSLDRRFPLLHAGGVNEEGYYVPPRPMTVLGRVWFAELENRIGYELEEFVAGK